MGVPGSANPLLLASTAADTGYQVSRSVRLNAPDSAFLSRTPSSAGNRKTWTFSFWCKRVAFPAGITFVLGAFPTASTEFIIGFNSSQQFYIEDYPGSYAISIVSSAVFRDPSAWYHFLVSVDTTQSTAANRVKLYVNGSQITALAAATYPSQNYDVNIWDTSQATAIGARGRTFVSPADLYLAEIHFIDGQALTPSSFAETNATTGQWVPKAYTGSYGSQGWKLDFADNSAATAAALGKDTSGNGNNWTPNNLSVTAGAGNDSLVDTPVSSGTDTGVGGEVRGNYCTFSPIDKGSSLALANGNLDVTTSSTNQMVRGTLGVKTGKWYYEATVGSTGNNIGVGIFNEDAQPISYSGTGNYIYTYATSGNKISAAGAAAYGASLAAGDVVGIALDGDNATLTFYKNGSSQGTAYTGLDTAKTWFPCWFSNVSAATAWSFNFGQRPFAYTAPSGFKALCDTNLPTPVVANPSTVFDTKLYTGNGSTQNITGLGFSPDLVWVKMRNGVEWNVLTDAVRGDQKSLFTNATNAEDTGRGITLASTGFSVDSWAGVNTNSGTYVAWLWDAGSSTVTNTQGSITSTVRANASAGFSVITYTGNGVSGATIGHGLGVAPEFFVVKCRNTTATGWLVYAKPLAATSFLQLESTAAVASNATAWNNTAPSSTTITLGNSAFSNGNTQTYVCYAWAPVAGYSSFGSYTGNGSADGPFIYTGFRPRWILYKSATTTWNWIIFDTSRDPYNICTQYLYANASQAEAAFGFFDITSNGYKIRSSDVQGNASGQTYIYAAFAESPFQYARAR